LIFSDLKYLDVIFIPSDQTRKSPDSRHLGFLLRQTIGQPSSLLSKLIEGFLQLPFFRAQIAPVPAVHEPFVLPRRSWRLPLQMGCHLQFRLPLVL
jgi:hypothetical protein